MGFTSFLKKVGLGVIKYLPLVLGAGQAIADRLPAATPAVDKLDQISILVMTIERAFEAAGLPGSGAQKFQALLPFVHDLIMQSELVTGHGVADEALLEKGVTELAQGVVDILNSLKGTDGTAINGTATLVVPKLLVAKP